MNTESYINDFLSRGGAITRCPTVYCAPVIGAVPIRSGVADMEDAVSYARRKDDKEKRKRGLDAIHPKKTVKRKATDQELNNLAAGRIAQRERAMAEAVKLLDMYNSGTSLEEIASIRGCGLDRARDVLRKAGFTGRFPQGAK